jgi:hypothetical protein
LKPGYFEEINMKLKFFKVLFLIMLSADSIMLQTAAAETEVMMKVKPHAVYHVIKNKTLKETVAQLSKRTGIKFQVNPVNQADIINQKLAADDWQSALTQLLQGYNYTLETAHGKVKAVVITGKNGSGVYHPISKEKPSVDELSPSQAQLPKIYQSLKPGSVLVLDLPMEKLAQLSLGDKTVLDLPIGQYTVKHDNSVDDGNGESTWIGYLEEEGKAYRIYISKGEDGIMGNVTTPDGIYNIDTVDSQTYLVDLARSGMTVGGFHGDQALLAEIGASGLYEIGLKTAAELPSIGNQNLLTANETASATTATSVVDIMMYYTIQSQTAAKAKQRIKYLINVANQAFLDSKINLRLRIVHTRSTDYPDTVSNSTALADLRNARKGFSGMWWLRKKYGADLVFLMRPYYRFKSGSCGTTYVGFSNGGGGNSTFGFGTISDGYARDNDPNSSTKYYCGIETFAHEVGHSLGAVHDRENSSFPGKDAYSYAWGIDHSFGTIMSYYGPTILLYSTPLLATECAGVPCGYPEGDANSSDQSRTINTTGPIVAKYKPRTISKPVIQ